MKKETRGLIHNFVFFLPFRPITSHPLLQYLSDVIMSFLSCHVYLYYIDIGRIAMHVKSINVSTLYLALFSAGLSP